jgi:thioesterase domain-containing protein
VAPQTVTLKPGAPTKPPLFCVPAQAGDVSLYHGLAHHLGPGRPVLGLYAPPAQELGDVQRRFEEIANRYLGAIKRAQPDGPYLIVGECSGGALAYEIARQLRAAGGQVAMLALIDAFPKGSPPLARHMPRSVYRVVHRARILAFHCTNLLRLPPRAKLAYATSKAMRAWRALRAKAVRLLCRSTNVPSAQAIFGEALAAYHPKPQGGSALLFRAARLPLGIEKADDLGWGKLLDVEVERIPGYFTTPISEPGVRVLAQRLSRRLDECAE